MPERIVIPQNVNGEQVTGFQYGMFYHNFRIKEVVLPSNVKAISNGMFRDTIYLEKVENTEQIESIGNGAFGWSRVKELCFPNLTTLGSNVFMNCSCLRLIDIGKITSVSNSSFYYCENLAEVLGGENVTSIGRYAFGLTRRLKNLSFLKNVTSVGECTFWSSACDLEALPSGCEFGDNASYKQFNDTDYWSGATFTPCKIPLNSVFHQEDPRWANKTMADFVADGVPCTYGSNGCALIVLAEIYSVFEGVHFDSPEEFTQILIDKGLTYANGYDYRFKDGWCRIANALGYETELITEMSTENLQKVYDALSQGALIYRSVLGKASATASADGGHAVLGYGINSNGEMLTADTSMHCSEVGIYENHKSAWHIYKHGSKYCDVVIVKKVVT